MKVGIQQAPGEEQGNYPVAPDFRQSFVGAQGNEEEAVETMAVWMLPPAAWVK